MEPITTVKVTSAGITQLPMVGRVLQRHNSTTDPTTPVGPGKAAWGKVGGEGIKLGRGRRNGVGRGGSSSKDVCQIPSLRFKGFEAGEGPRKPIGERGNGNSFPFPS